MDFRGNISDLLIGCGGFVLVSIHQVENTCLRFQPIEMSNKKLGSSCGWQQQSTEDGRIVVCRYG